MASFLEIIVDGAFKDSGLKYVTTCSTFGYKTQVVGLELESVAFFSFVLGQGSDNMQGAKRVSDTFKTPTDVSSGYLRA
jgi:hypothetical protein